MKRIIAIILLFVMAFSFASCGVRISDTPAPDFEFKDSEGRTVKLSDFYGKPIVINFWATWCGYCVEEFPYFEQACAKYGNDVSFIMLNSGEARETGNSFIKDLGLTFSVYYDEDSSATNKYGITGYPTTFFIRANGEIAYKKVGGMTANELNQYISVIYDN